MLQLQCEKLDRSHSAPKGKGMKSKPPTIMPESVWKPPVVCSFMSTGDFGRQKVSWFYSFMFGRQKVSWFYSFMFGRQKVS